MTTDAGSTVDTSGRELSDERSMPLLHQFLKDLKSSPPKSAALGVLMLIGLWFWLPPVWNAVASPPTAHASTVPTSAAPPTLAVPTSSVSASASAAASSAPASRPLAPASVGADEPSSWTEKDWQEMERIRSTDRLFSSAAPNEIRGDAFTLSGEFLPIEAELAIEPRKPQPIIAKSPPPPAPPLTLRSTLVGPDRRAALINGKIYPEGSVIPAAGAKWILRTVEPRRVVLDANGRTYELRIDPFTSSKSQIGRK